LEIVPIIIAVVVFLFSSVFDNSKKKPAPKPKRPQVPKQVNAEVERERQVMTVPVKSKKVVQVEKPLSELERLQRENASLQKKINMMEKQRNRVVQGPIINKNQPLEESEGLFTKDNIVQAVVFSEVLASPRSRNPHRASMQHSVTSRK
jgi:hypothetical protein